MSSFCRAGGESAPLVPVGTPGKHSPGTPAPTGAERWLWASSAETPAKPFPPVCRTAQGFLRAGGNEWCSLPGLAPAAAAGGKGGQQGAALHRRSARCPGRSCVSRRLSRYLTPRATCSFCLHSFVVCLFGGGGVPGSQHCIQTLFFPLVGAQLSMVYPPVNQNPRNHARNVK